MYILVVMFCKVELPPKVKKTELLNFFAIIACYILNHFTQNILFKILKLKYYILNTKNTIKIFSHRN